MLSFATPTGGDMSNYLSMGSLCAHGQDYWNPIRPQGFIEYVSIPFRMGWDPQAIITMNLILVALSVLLAGLAWNAIIPALKSRPWYFSVFKYAFIAAGHLAFMWGPARSALSDVPAACAALISVWLYIIACGRNNAWLLALAGIFMGVSITFRVFYYYPAFALILGAAFACVLLRRLSLSAVAGLMLMLAFPVYTQYAFIYRRIHVWALEDPTWVAQMRASEMSAIYGAFAFTTDPGYGVDIIGNDKVHWYTCGDCLRGPGGWQGALDTKDYWGIVKLAWKRNEFYVGSWVPQVAITDSKQRVFSLWLELANWLALLSTAALFFSVKRRWILGAPLLFVAASWVMAIGIAPESRYIMLVLAFAWSLGPLYWIAARKPEGPAAPKEGVALA